MIKILFFIPDLSGGGAEKVLCNLVNNLDLSKFDITVQTVKYYEPTNYLKAGIHYKSIFHCRSRIAEKILNLWYRFCTEIKLTYPLYIKDDYDIEVAYLECGATKVMAASKNIKAVKLAWVHCDVKKKGLTAESVGKYYTKFDKVVCVSKEAKKSFDEAFGQLVGSTVLYNVIDESDIFAKANSVCDIQWDSDVIHLLTVGRLNYEKGFDRLIEVGKMLKDKGYHFKIHLVGDGIEKEKLQYQVKESKLSAYVQFEGYLENPYPYMKQADIIVIPSRTEALSTVAIEALVLGKPVVTTPCAGMNELFGCSEYGIVTEDSTEGLYLGISKLMDSSELQNKYALLAMDRGKMFMKKSVISDTENFFAEIAAGNG